MTLNTVTMVTAMTCAMRENDNDPLVYPPLPLRGIAASYVPRFGAQAEAAFNYD